MNKHWGMFLRVFGFFSFLLLPSLFWFPVFYLAQKFIEKPIQTSSDAAAWAQCFGTVVAISVAVLLPKWEQSKKQLQTIKDTVAYQVRLMSFLDTTIQRIEKDGFADSGSLRANLEELIVYGRRLDISLLKMAKTWAMIDQLSLTNEIFGYAVSMNQLKLENIDLIKEYSRRASLNFDKYRNSVFEE